MPIIGALILSHRTLKLTCAISESVKFYLDTPQCKHVMLACCHDGGYVPFLGHLIGNPSVYARMTLIEGGIVAPAFQQLEFRRASFPSVFVDLNPNLGPLSNGNTHKVEIAPQQMRKLASVTSNASGRRMDFPLSVDPNLIKEIKTQNLCHWLFLRGDCRGCLRNHSYHPLTDPEFDALWLLARQGPCRTLQHRGRCDDTQCIYGYGQD